MAGATFSRVKVWTTEIVTNTDLNAEFDNILNNLNPAGLDGAQDTLVAKRATSAPSEITLAMSLLTEVQEIRYMLLALAGGNSIYWYSTPTTSLTDLKNAIGGALVNNRLVSGAVSTTSSAPRFLTPAGSLNSVTIRGTTTPLVYVINGTSYTLAADTTLSTMSLAPSSNNTATVNDATLAAQESSKTQGEDGTIITMSSAGTGITALVGQLAAFKVVHSAVTEYFLAYVNSTTQLTAAYRGFFVDSSRVPIDRTVISNADTITLMKLTWLFIGTTGGVTPVYTNPTWSAIQPTSPNTGDYWYDMVNSTWKTYGGVSWAASNTILIGVCIQDATNCVGARAFNYYTGVDGFSSMNLQWLSNTQIQQLNFDGRASVNGSNASYVYTRPIWDVTANLETSQARSVSTTYYAYASESGQQYLTTKKPYDMRGTLKGWYHPSENWRAIAKVQTNATGSGNFDPQTIVQYDLASTVISQSSLPMFSNKFASNIGIKASVASSACTITITQADGVTPPNANSPAIVGFRGSTITTFSYIPRYITSSLSITIPNGASLGHTSAVAQYVWIYLIDDAGTLDVGVSGVQLFQEEYIVGSATAISSGATSGASLYSVSGHTNKAFRLIGRLLVTEATAGVWLTAPAQIDVLPTPTVNITEPVACTPAFSNLGTCASISFVSWRTGRLLQMQGRFNTGTVVASVASMTVAFNGTNNNVAIDSTYVPSSPNTTVGVWAGSVANTGGLVNVNTNGATNLIYFSNVSATNVYNANANGTVFGNATTCTINITSLFIAGWSTFGP